MIMNLQLPLVLMIFLLKLIPFWSYHVHSLSLLAWPGPYGLILGPLWAYTKAALAKAAIISSRSIAKGGGGQQEAPTEALIKFFQPNLKIMRNSYFSAFLRGCCGHVEKQLRIVMELYKKIGSRSKV